MTTTNIPPCPKCGVVPELPLLCSCLAHTANKIDSNPTEWSASKLWGVLSDIALVGALRDLGIETVAQVRELASSNMTEVYGIMQVNDYEHSPVLAVVHDESEAKRIVEHTEKLASEINEIERENDYEKTRKSKQLRKQHYSFIGEYDATHEQWRVVTIPVLRRRAAEGEK